MNRFFAAIADSRWEHPGAHGWIAFSLFLIVIPAVLVPIVGMTVLNAIAPAAGLIDYFQAVAMGGLCLGAGFYLIGTSKLAKEPAREAHLHSDELPRLAVITCGSCGAPLPISAEDQTCPFCSASYTLPAEYEETLALRRKAASELRLAEKRWKRVQVINRLSYPLYLLSSLTMFCAIAGVRKVPDWIGVGDFIAALLIFLSGYVVGGYGDAVPPVPETTESTHKAEVIHCKICQAPLTCAAGELSAICNYCGAENYRAAYTEFAEEVASTSELGAAKSLYDAMNEFRVRVRAIMKLYFGVLLFAAVVLVGQKADALKHYPPVLDMVIVFGGVILLLAVIAFFFFP